MSVEERVHAVLDSPPCCPHANTSEGLNLEASPSASDSSLPSDEAKPESRRETPELDVVSDKQVEKLFKEMDRHGQVSRAALASGMSRKTASKYIKARKLPSAMKRERTWRTRKDPFEEVWPQVEEKLTCAPELEAATLFEWLQEEHPGDFEPGQLRTLQRRIRDWRAQSGPEQEVFFPQKHRPGEAAQTDFTCSNELGVTIGGEPLKHMLCHVVLPYSCWEWATVCFSESMMALRDGVQAAMFRLGGVPEYHQTDNSTAATHRIARKEEKRTFNDDYLGLMRHLGMQPRRTGIGKKEQNGSVEALNGALKRRLKQYLLLRGSRDFESLEAYQAWVNGIVEKVNRRRESKVEEERKYLKPLPSAPLPDYDEILTRVRSWSTIRVRRNTYSVPSRLIGYKVKVRIYESRIEVYYGGQHQLTTERLLGKNRHAINYRHVIWTLIRKPGAFLRYHYREELFPTVIFRRAYDALCAHHTSQRQADLAYLRILLLAASTAEGEVEAALECLLESEQLPSVDAVKELTQQPQRPTVPHIEPFTVNYDIYDALLGGER